MEFFLEIVLCFCPGKTFVVIFLSCRKGDEDKKAGIIYPLLRGNQTSINTGVNSP